MKHCQFFENQVRLTESAILALGIQKYVQNGTYLFVEAKIQYTFINNKLIITNLAVTFKDVIDFMIRV